MWPIMARKIFFPKKSSVFTRKIRLQKYSHFCVDNRAILVIWMLSDLNLSKKSIYGGSRIPASLDLEIFAIFGKFWIKKMRSNFFIVQFFPKMDMSACHHGAFLVWHELKAHCVECEVWIVFLVPPTAPNVRKTLKTAIFGGFNFAVQYRCSWVA